MTEQMAGGTENMAGGMREMASHCCWLEVSQYQMHSMLNWLRSCLHHSHPVITKETANSRAPRADRIII